jgi:hypothetical protein
MLAHEPFQSRPSHDALARRDVEGIAACQLSKLTGSHRSDFRSNFEKGLKVTVTLCGPWIVPPLDQMDLKAGSEDGT